jgi:hypothetical protein
MVQNQIKWWSDREDDKGLEIFLMATDLAANNPERREIGGNTFHWKIF